MTINYANFNLNNLSMELYGEERSAGEFMAHKHDEID